ncbi:MAG: hypothetical protein H8E55_65850 [Pelagibacterales bacterium]|nr:hypothetical protein [Pelagibacterales bacterium]
MPPKRAVKSSRRANRRSTTNRSNVVRGTGASNRRTSPRKATRRKSNIVRRGAKNVYQNRSCPSGMTMDVNGQCVSSARGDVLPYGSTNARGGFRKRGRKIATKKDLNAFKLRRTMFGSELK